jgi:excisionase family DNA binding protein
LVFGAHARYVSREYSSLLTTGEVALLLGSSRQHVVDLCEGGALAFVRVGTHRRIRHDDVDRLLRGQLNRDQQKALWLHQAVAGRLVHDPQAVLTKARQNIQRMRRTHRIGMAVEWIQTWEQTIDDGVDAVLDTLTSTSPRAVELRQNSPFAGVLSETERRAILDAFARNWRSSRAA